MEQTDRQRGGGKVTVVVVVVSLQLLGSERSVRVNSKIVTTIIPAKLTGVFASVFTISSKHHFETLKHACSQSVKLHIHTNYYPTVNRHAQLTGCVCVCVCNGHDWVCVCVSAMDMTGYACVSAMDMPTNCMCACVRVFAAMDMATDQVMPTDWVCVCVSVCL